jgi:hypothetical protein
MTPDQISQAGRTRRWRADTEGTLAAVLPILWLLMLALHLARPYMLTSAQFLAPSGLTKP